MISIDLAVFMVEMLQDPTKQHGYLPGQIDTLFWMNLHFGKGTLLWVSWQFAQKVGLRSFFHSRSGKKAPPLLPCPVTAHNFHGHSCPTYGQNRTAAFGPKKTKETDVQFVGSLQGS